MKLIPKHQNKSPIKKQNWFTKATLNAAMADNPAVMTSAGWNIDSSTGEVKQDNKAFETGSPEESLRNNLAVISTFAPTHPLNAVFEMTPWIYRGGLYALGKAGNTAAKNRYIATTLNDVVKETELATHEPILNVGWGPSQTIIGTHASNKPVTKFVPFNRWDVKNYKADPYGYFVTEGQSAGIMSERPVQQTINVELKKPIVQVGEVGKSGINKNTSRNQLIQQARNQGADGYIIQDIADNKANHQNVIFKFIDGEGEIPSKVKVTQHQPQHHESQSSINFMNAYKEQNQLIDLINRFNKWADYYGYSKIPKNTSLLRSKDIMKKTFDRHNTFFRGLRPPELNEDIIEAESILGKNYSIDDFYKYAAITPRRGDDYFFISPESNSLIYGGNGKTAIVRRKYKLSNNPQTWLDDADFDILYTGNTNNPKDSFTFPWSNRGNGIVENEILAPKGTLEFIGFVPENNSLEFVRQNGSLNKYLGNETYLDRVFDNSPMKKPEFGYKSNNNQ